MGVIDSLLPPRWTTVMPESTSTPASAMHTLARRDYYYSVGGLSPWAWVGIGIGNLIWWTLFFTLLAYLIGRRNKRNRETMPYQGTLPSPFGNKTVTENQSVQPATGGYYAASSKSLKNPITTT